MVSLLGMNNDAIWKIFMAADPQKVRVSNFRLVRREKKGQPWIMSGIQII